MLLATASTAARRAPVLLFVAALSIRLLVLAGTYETPGDGPSRAIAAFNWAQTPTVPTWGVWPPGFLFLSGAAAMLVRDPNLSTRLLNLLIGSATVAVLYLLARRVFGATVALASACVLCVLPLHVGLSASSMSEPAFVLELMAGLLLLIGPRAPGRAWAQRARLVSGVLCLVLASMTRYEVWTLLPLFVVHDLKRNGSRRASLLLAAALLAFPVAWTISNYVHSGDPWIGFTAATSYIGITQTPASPLRAAELMASWSDWQLGWLLPAAIAFGAVWELVRALRGRSEPARLLYLAIVAVQCVVLLRFTMVRGENVWTRYLIGSLVFALPLAFIPWAGRTSAPGSLDDLDEPILRRACTLAALAIFALFLPWVVDPERIESRLVTSREPVVVEDLAAWLRESGRVDQQMLLTPMEWEATYVALGAPQTSRNSLIVSEWTDDRFLRRWIWDHRPKLLVTRSGDEPYVERIQAALDDHLEQAAVLFRSERVRVLDISGATSPDHLRAPPD
jgi:hypothetical protein